MRKTRSSTNGSDPATETHLPAVSEEFKGWPEPLNRPFRIIAFDWDGTAVKDRRQDTTLVRWRLERLLQLGVHIVVITGTNFGNVDRQLSSTIKGPHKQGLYICTNRGSEVYGFDAESRPVLICRRQATPEEDQKLTAVAETVQRTLETATGLDVAVIYDRLNRRKVDVIPLPEWQNPPKSAIGQLLQATEERLEKGGLSGGLKDVIALTKRVAKEVNLPDARITSDVKHIEVGLTDKADSVAWLMYGLAANEHVPAEDILIAGDEFGPIASFEGSDYRMVTPVAKGAVYVSVGPEPNGVPSGVIHIDGGPSRFRELLDHQIALREGQQWGLSLDLPTVDPSWLLYEQGFTPEREHELESLFSLGNGYAGTRGAISGGSPFSAPATFVAGVFDAPTPANPIPKLVVAPDWPKWRMFVDGQELGLERNRILEHRRTLDMRRGILLREWRQQDAAGRITRLRTMRFVSLADCHALVQVVMVQPENYSGTIRLESFVDGRVTNRGGLVLLEPVHASAREYGPLLVMRTLGSDILLAMSAVTAFHDTENSHPAVEAVAEDRWIMERWNWEALIGQRYRIDKLTSLYTSRDTDDPGSTAGQHLAQLAKQGPESLFLAHVRAWAKHWSKADIKIRDDATAQRAVRFALYHLISAAYSGDERVSVGARALTGQSYDGHVFWDTETFILPFYIFTDPPTARALLMYRYYTLPAARAKAKGMGYRGALYAWESALTGEETTPPLVVVPGGKVVPVLSGTLEQHISADIAFAVWQYWQATGDDAFLRDAGAEIILEVARFWASRAVLGEDNRYHFLEVVGPDEYHEGVDDNAFTNWMARWSLQQGLNAANLLRRRWPHRWAALARELQIEPAELAEWRRIADGIVTAIDPTTNLIEQFAGYFGLEYIDLQSYEPRRVPMDVILGHDRTEASQVIKQADVVLLLHLFWDQLSPAMREANFRYYKPRTGHGSSLSPGIYALVAARLGDVDAAMSYFRQVCEIDLSNNMGNAAGGIHIAAQGSIWQAVVFGFAGMSLREDGLRFDPHLPHAWRSVEFPVQWRGRIVRLTLQSQPHQAEVVVEGPEPLTLQLGDQPGQVIEPGCRYRARLVGDAWGPWKEVSE